MYDPVLDQTYRLFVKGMGYLQKNHIYKFKDYSECIFDTQVQSKWWLTETLAKRESRDRNVRHISILASWYGIVIVPLLFKRFGRIPIDLYDVDEYTVDIAKHIYKDEYNDMVTVHCKDIVFDDLDLQGNVIINCSCEHMFDMSHIVHQYPDALYVLQSNNNRNVKWLHINCVDDLGQLARQADIRNVLCGQSKEVYGQKRMMIIGTHLKDEEKNAARN